MEQQEKHYATAYFFWLLVGIFGGHRFYLARGSSAMLFVVAHFGSWGFLIYAWQTDSVQYAWPALLLLAAVYAWLVVDLIFIPAMADNFNDKLEVNQGPYLGGPISMDPGFQATLKKAGMGAESPRKSGIPDDYVMPWRRQDGGGPTASGGG
ncbi:MAG: TM2 domain-containing protein [Pseudomonadota bacterium]